MIDRFVEPDPDALSLLNQRVKLFREAAKLRSITPVPSDQSSDPPQPRAFRHLDHHSLDHRADERT
ncbi:MAG: hypothetical protein ABIR28_12295 [Vicinamibacteria bacterium]